MAIWQDVLNRIMQGEHFRISSERTESDTVGDYYMVVARTAKVEQIPTFIDDGTDERGHRILSRRTGLVDVQFELEIWSDLVGVRAVLHNAYGQRLPIETLNGAGSCRWLIVNFNETYGERANISAGDRYVRYAMQLRLDPRDFVPEEHAPAIQWQEPIQPTFHPGPVSTPGCIPDYSAPLNRHSWPNFDESRAPKPRKVRPPRPKVIPAEPAPKPAPPAERVFRAVEDEE